MVNDVFDNSDNFYHHYRIVRQQQPERVLSGLEFVFIELPKFKAHTHTAKRVQALWLRFMNLVDRPNEEVAELIQAPLPELQQAIKLIEVGAYTPAELAGYHKSIDQARIESTLIRGTLAKGREEGSEQGRAEGLAEGLAAGQQSERQTIARKLKLQGIATSVITQVTGLSERDIEQLD